MTDMLLCGVCGGESTVGGGVVLVKSSAYAGQRTALVEKSVSLCFIYDRSNLKRYSTLKYSKRW